MLIPTALGEISFSCRLKMTGYAAKAFSRRCLLQVSENVLADCCVRGATAWVDCGGGWCVSCHNVAGEGKDVAVKRGPFGVG